jgi:hypothetical protein
MALPALDLSFMAFEGAPGGALATEAQAAQQMPDMARMVVHPVPLADEGRDAREGPEGRGMARRLWPIEESLSQFVLLLGRESAFAPGRPLALERGPAVLPPAHLPGVSGLAPHAQAPSDFAGAVSLVEERHRLEPPLLHRRVISFARHAFSMALT